uniref:WAP-type 'four-disulfide core n=1 Tax=Elaeophora elaphi TaxID=1147741 RepID=A0A0R3RKJ0_9BILA
MCTAACQENVLDMEGCQGNICKHVREPEACKHSCAYLHEIYKKKPGTCPNSSHLAPSNECTALCHLDGDCPETKKCCVEGCSRQCLKPQGKDLNLLPIPTGISVQERKRKRSVIVRWVMQQMSRTQTNSNANLYVVQWRWSLHKDGTSMSDWQTIVTRNKMYAILKHLLAPGRYYMFRVAAVNTYGSLGFSKSSQPFKLSKEPRAPGQPLDLTLDNSKINEHNFWIQRIKWTPPFSELPIKNYVLSWQKSTMQQAMAYEQMLQRRLSIEKQEKRSTIDEEEDEVESEDSFVERERMSVVIPAYHSYADIDQLELESVYLVEIYAIVDSSDGELHGEKAILYVKTGAMNVNKGIHINSSNINGNSNIITTTIQSQNWKLESRNGLQGGSDSSHIMTDIKVETLDIRTPYFDDNNLKTLVSWFRNGLCNGTRVKYTIRWRLLMCRVKENKRITYYDLDSSGEDWAQMEVQECVAVLEDLDFSCSYNVELVSTNTKQVIAKAHFETESCEKTPSTVTLRCNDQLTSQFLSCIGNPKNNSVRCNWKNINGTVKNVGYRIVLNKSGTEDNRIVIVPPQSTTVEFDKLEPDHNYLIHIQTITSNGLGNTLTTSFRINRNKTSEKFSSSSLLPGHHRNDTVSHISSIIMDHIGDQISQNIDLQSSVIKEDNGFLYNNERFPGATVLELPLESTASGVIRWTALYFICIDLLSRYLFTVNTL